MPIATIAQYHSAVECFFVVTGSEAILLRRAGITKPIVVVGYIDVPLDECIYYDFDVAIYSKELLYALNERGRAAQKKIRVHVKVQTGMARLGLPADEVYVFVKELYSLPFISWQGIYTHLADVTNLDQAMTQAQLARFDSVVHALAADTIIFPYTHVFASGGLVVQHDQAYTIARIGTQIYGCWKSAFTEQTLKKRFPDIELRPVLSWKTKIIHIVQIPQGSSVGYGHMFTASRPTRVGVLPVGYWDGYPRALSNKSCVQVQQKFAPVIGAVSMNMIMIDITDIPAAVGDTVTLIGAGPYVNAITLAAQAETISNELLTRINPAITRIII